ncbi:MAG: preprotein translocase subunit YajC [Phascolarctobacterium sp.]|nr:preprotein translocase subunit YajC [Candidatus Phascolarctobacterium equi]
MSNETMALMQSVSPFVLMGALFYFMIWRPQRKEQQARKNLLDSLKPGDVVYTIGGMVGTIADLTEKTVVLEVAEGVKVTFIRKAISGKRE